jgi:hypothetical protein
VDIGRIVVPGSLGIKVCKTPSRWKKAEHGGRSLSSLQWREAYNRKIMPQVVLGKINREKRAGLWFK